MPHIPKRFKRAKKGKFALLIFGQGSQRLGMGRSGNGDQAIELLEEFIEEAKSVVDPFQIDRIRHLMLVDPVALSPIDRKILEQEINRTDNAQIALFLQSAALWEKYASDEDNVIPNVVFGHSAGEPIAGYVSSAFDFGDCLKYVFARGHLMHIANNFYKGGMVIVGPPKGAESINMKLLENCLKGTTMEIANDNTPMQIVVSGKLAELAWVCEKLREKQFRATPLKNVVGAYHHSKAMGSVRDGLDALLPYLKIKKPATKWIFNFSGAEEDDVKKIKTYLVGQPSSMVKWRQNIERAIELGITDFEQLGGDKLVEMLDDFPVWQKIKASKQTSREAKK